MTTVHRNKTICLTSLRMRPAEYNTGTLAVAVSMVCYDTEDVHARYPQATRNRIIGCAKSRKKMFHHVAKTFGGPHDWRVGPVTTFLQGRPTVSRRAQRRVVAVVDTSKARTCTGISWYSKLAADFCQIVAARGISRGERSVRTYGLTANAKGSLPRCPLLFVPLGRRGPLMSSELLLERTCHPQTLVY
jgi:hypothetical protein